MSEQLSVTHLMKHMRALTRSVGPRPAGHPAEAVAQEYVRDTLQAIGFTVEEMPFAAWDTWGYTTVTPILLTLAANLAGKLGRVGKALGGLVTLAAAYHIWQASSCNRQPLAPLYARNQAKNLLVRLPSTGERRHRVVLVGHTDTNKHRLTFTPAMKHWLPLLGTLNILLPAFNGVVQLAQATGKGQGIETVHRLSLVSLLATLGLLVVDEMEGYVEGANDNATAVSCLLGLAAYLKENPLAHTEVWFAFTSAEEVGCVGMHHLLDVYGHLLQNAYFIDFEMVGTKEVAYVTHHSGFSYLNGYTPDVESVRLAEKVARQHPELAVNGRPLVIGEEVGALRGRDFRGICLAGVGDDGWLANWHQYSDNLEQIVPTGIERASRFALAMMQQLDGQN